MLWSAPHSGRCRGDGFRQAGDAGPFDQWTNWRGFDQLRGINAGNPLLMRTATSYHPRGEGLVPKGKKQFVVDLKYDAGRLRKRGITTLSVNVRELADRRSTEAAPVQPPIEEGLEHKV